MFVFILDVQTFRASARHAGLPPQRRRSVEVGLGDPDDDAGDESYEVWGQNPHDTSKFAQRVERELGLPFGMKVVCAQAS